MDEAGHSGLPSRHDLRAALERLEAALARHERALRERLEAGLEVVPPMRRSVELLRDEADRLRALLLAYGEPPRA
jgi:hypothetical protein